MGQPDRLAADLLRARRPGRLSTPETPAGPDVVIPLGPADLNEAGHVRQARFHEFLDAARDAVFLAVADPSGVYPYALARIELDHRGELLAGDREVRIRTTLEELGRKKVVLRHVLTGADGTHVAEGRSIMVAFDFGARASRVIADDERAALGAVFGA